MWYTAIKLCLNILVGLGIIGNISLLKDILKNVFYNIVGLIVKQIYVHITYYEKLFMRRIFFFIKLLSFLSNWFLSLLGDQYIPVIRKLIFF